MTTAFAQPIADMVIIPRKDALATLAKAEKANILEEKLSQKQKDIDTLSERITTLNSIISEMSVTDEAQKSIIQSYEKQIREMDGIRKLFELDATVYKKQIRKLRRAVFWTKLAGIAAIAGSFWIGSNIK